MFTPNISVVPNRETTSLAVYGALPQISYSEGHQVGEKEESKEVSVPGKTKTRCR